MSGRQTDVRRGVQAERCVKLLRSTARQPLLARTVSRPSPVSASTLNSPGLVWSGPVAVSSAAYDIAKLEYDYRCSTC